MTVCSRKRWFSTFHTPSKNKTKHQTIREESRYQMFSSSIWTPGFLCVCQRHFQASWRKSKCKCVCFALRGRILPPIGGGNHHRVLSCRHPPTVVSFFPCCFYKAGMSKCLESAFIMIFCALYFDFFFYPLCCLSPSGVSSDVTSMKLKTIRIILEGFFFSLPLPWVSFNPEIASVFTMT